MRKLTVYRYTSSDMVRPMVVDAKGLFRIQVGPTGELYVGDEELNRTVAIFANGDWAYVVGPFDNLPGPPHTEWPADMTHVTDEIAGKLAETLAAVKKRSSGRAKTKGNPIVPLDEVTKASDAAWKRAKRTARRSAKAPTKKAKQRPITATKARKITKKVPRRK